MVEEASSAYEWKDIPKEDDGEDEVETDSGIVLLTRIEVVAISLGASRPRSSGGLFQYHIE